MNRTDLLKAAQGQGKLVELYTDADDLEKFAAGIVLAMDDEHLILSSITESGAYDGLVLFPLDSILLQAADAFPPVELPDIGRLDQALLDYAARRQLVVSVELLGSGYYDCRGLVRQSGPECFLMDALTVYGEADGVRLVPLKNVTQIACDTSDEQIIARLIGKRA